MSKIVGKADITFETGLRLLCSS